jgi:hypothetical protein
MDIADALDILTEYSALCLEKDDKWKKAYDTCIAWTKGELKLKLKLWIKKLSLTLLRKLKN